MARKQNKYYVIEVRETGKAREWLTDGYDPKVFSLRKDAINHIYKVEKYLKLKNYNKNVKLVILRVRIEVDDKRWTRQGKNKP